MWRNAAKTSAFALILALALGGCETLGQTGSKSAAGQVMGAVGNAVASVGSGVKQAVGTIAGSGAGRILGSTACQLGGTMVGSPRAAAYCTAAAQKLGRTELFRAGSGQRETLVQLSPDARFTLGRAISLHADAFGCYEEIRTGYHDPNNQKVVAFNSLWSDGRLSTIRLERDLKAAIDDAATNPRYRAQRCAKSGGGVS